MIDSLIGCLHKELASQRGPWVKRIARFVLQDDIRAMKRDHALLLDQWRLYAQAQERYRIEMLGEHPDSEVGEFELWYKANYGWHKDSK